MKVIIIVGLWFLSLACYGRTLVVGYYTSHTAPYIFSEDSRIIGGITKDIGDELGERLKVNVKYWLTTRGRVEDDIASGRIDILINFNPIWSKKVELHHWSIPIYREKNVFVTKKSSGLIVRELDDLSGKRLGTIFKYKYPNLTTYFESKIVTRDDVYELTQNFERLEHNLIDALVQSEILIRYYLKSRGKYGDFVISPLPQSDHEIFSILSKKSPVSISELNAAYRAMIKEGVISRILGKYR